MDLLRTTLEQQPLMALFFTIAVGALLGEKTFNPTRADIIDDAPKGDFPHPHTMTPTGG